MAETSSLVRIPRVHHPPTLQAFVDGTPREAEVAISGFVQFDPVDGAPVSEATAAYLSYDERNLYVAWICKDDPAKVRARLTRRKDIAKDDRVSIDIDTFRDRKHAYWFDANPYGVQYDGRINDGQGDDDKWESVWYTEARFTENGYVVLETIPFRSLRFPSGPTQRWGIALARYIQRKNEVAMWPAVSRKNLPHFVAQFADLEIPENISSGRNMQFTPYGMFSGSRYLDTAKGFRAASEQRVGLDSKIVIRDALTLDTAINPDFSQVESDEPQVTVNQRYEVVYSERRPFFMENASLFKLPEELFFSRRIVGPQFGTRLTGTAGHWAFGFLVADDRAPGKLVGADNEDHGKRGLNEVLRVQREFGRQSHIGALVTNTSFGSTWNRVTGIDTRITLGSNWSVEGQLATSGTRLPNGARLDGHDFFARLSKNGSHTYLESRYSDRSPQFRANLGYVPRVDIREWNNYGEYHWRPKHSVVTDFGPVLSQSLVWDQRQRLQEWSVSPWFSINLLRLTQIAVGRDEKYETYNDIGFRTSANRVQLSTEPFKWLALNGELRQGTAINYYPSSGLVPFLARQRYVAAGFTLRPMTQLRIDESYLYTRLGGEREWLPVASPQKCTAILNNHILRTKANYQFSRELSLRAIVDYNAVLPNQGLISVVKSKRIGADLLLTYLLHPGTALYVGYSNAYENVAWNSSLNPVLQRTTFPSTQTGRQAFVKLSYLFR